MILTEYDRRWAEICFYQYCVEMYSYRHQAIDIFDYADTICNLGDIDKTTIKTLARTMLNDTYYHATKREIILIGSVEGLSTVQIANYLNMTRQGVAKFLRTHKELFTPLPRCNIDDDQILIKFINTLDTIKSIGTLGHGTTNEKAV